MGRYFEFWCRGCGHHYYRGSLEMKKCNNPLCKNENLEFSAIVESSDGMDGFMGQEKIITQRYPLDTKATS